MNKEAKESMISLGKRAARNVGWHFTLTPDHLYIHDKKKLHKSKVITKFKMPEDGEISASRDGGNTFERVCPFDGSTIVKGAIR